MAFNNIIENYIISYSSFVGNVQAPFTSLVCILCTAGPSITPYQAGDLLWYEKKKKKGDNEILEDKEEEDLVRWC